MYILDTKTRKPNRLERKKDENYHAEYARYCLSCLSDAKYRDYINKALINWSFFKGGDGQWIFEEDVEAFFLDESGDIRNRLKMSENIIKPMVQQYVGNAVRLSFDCKVDNVSEFIINQKEKEITKLRAYQEITNRFPFAKRIIEQFVELGENEMETQEIFENKFTEDYEQDLNNLLEFISQDINVDEIKVQLARNLALNGLAVYKGGEQTSNYVGEALNTLFYFWDMSAIKPDLTDSEFMGDWGYFSSTTLFECYPKLTSEERTAIEEYTSEKGYSIHRVINDIFSVQGDKVPVYTVVWRDVEPMEYGWVNDEFGYPYYTLVNHPDSVYTDKDLIEPQTEKHKEEMGDKKKHTIYPEWLRHCVFIPKEEIGHSEDIILEHGILPYQEKDMHSGKTKFPYKAYTWVYDRGEVLTPIDDVIDPQRFLNRTKSIVESHMNNMRGTGTVISKSAVTDDEADLVRNVNASKPIIVDTDRVGSVQNAVGTYGTNINNGTLQMFQVINELKRGVQDTTGVNEAMTGTQGGSDVLVGVMEAQIQRGSLIQEPFYWALTSVLRQAYEHMVCVGKNIYADSPRKLTMIVGDKGLIRINITKEQTLQEYRLTVKRSETKEQGIMAGNQLLFTLLQAQLIDQPRFSNLFNRANVEMIAKAMRDYQREKTMAQYANDKMQAETARQTAMDEQQMAMAANEAVAEDEQKYIGEKLLDHELEMEKIKEKGKTSGVYQLQNQQNQ